MLNAECKGNLPQAHEGSQTSTSSLSKMTKDNEKDISIDTLSKIKMCQNEKMTT